MSTAAEFFRNLYIVRHNITEVDMSEKRRIVCVEDINTHGERHVEIRGK